MKEPSGDARRLFHFSVGARRGLGLELKAHPHMLRHACGYALADKGHDNSGDSGMVGASLDHEHGGLYGPGPKQVQGFLARVSRPRARASPDVLGPETFGNGFAICEF
jgi:hypothetical protein